MVQLCRRDQPPTVREGMEQIDLSTRHGERRLESKRRHSHKQRGEFERISPKRRREKISPARHAAAP